MESWDEKWNEKRLSDSRFNYRIIMKNFLGTLQRKKKNVILKKQNFYNI